MQRNTACPGLGAVAGDPATARQGAALDADQRDRVAAEVALPRHRRLAVTHVRETFEMEGVAVDDGHHQGASREGLLALGVLREDVADGAELAFTDVGVERHVAVVGVVSRTSAHGPFA